MSISDWSSDVCSSDLLEGFVEWRYTARADVDRATAVVFTVTGRCVDHQDFIDRDAARELVADQCSLEFDTAKRRDQQQFDAIDRSRVVHRAPRQRRAGPPQFVAALGAENHRASAAHLAVPLDRN